MSLVGTESQIVDRYRRFEEIRGHQVRWSCEVPEVKVATESLSEELEPLAKAHDP